MNVIKSTNLLVAACCLFTFLAFFYAFLTLAGVGVFILPLAIVPWVGLILYMRARQRRTMVWIAAAPVLLYGLLLTAGYIIAPIL